MARTYRFGGTEKDGFKSQTGADASPPRAFRRANGTKPMRLITRNVCRSIILGNLDADMSSIVRLPHYT